MSLDKELTIIDYIKIVKRNSLYATVFFCVFFLIVVVFAVLATPVYQSVATILIQSSHIRSGEEKEKFATERFSKLNQVVLSKDNILKIAKKYKLYGLDKNKKITSEQLYSMTRSNIFIERLRAEPEGWDASATFAFNISFNHYDAEDTYNIANDLVNLFLVENDKFTKGQVIETEKFFGKEEEKRRLELESAEDKLASFKRRYSNSLPENKEIYVSSLARLETDLRANQLEYRATKAELRSLDVGLESAKSGNILIGGQERTLAPTDLEGLRLELSKQKSIYSDNHPSVRALQRRIDALANSSNTAEKTPSLTPSQSAMVAKIQAQIETANDRLESLKSEDENIRARISQAENTVMRSAQTDGELVALKREYENANAAYNDIKGKLENSKIAKSIEIENKGERFVLIEAPVIPESPIKPNRVLIILAGFIASIFGAIALVVLIDIMSSGVRGVDTIASIMNMQPMAAIPFIVSQAEEIRKKHLIYYFLIGILCLALIVLFVIHLFIMPIDLLISKIIARF